MASTISRRRHNGNGLLLFDDGTNDLSADKTRTLYTLNSQPSKGALQANGIDLTRSLEEKILPLKENQLPSAVKDYYDCIMTKDEQDRTLGEDFKLQTSLIQGIRGETGEKCCSKFQRHHHGKGWNFDFSGGSTQRTILHQHHETKLHQRGGNGSSWSNKCRFKPIYTLKCN